MAKKAIPVDVFTSTDAMKTGKPIATLAGPPPNMGDILHLEEVVDIVLERPVRVAQIHRVYGDAPVIKIIVNL